LHEPLDPPRSPANHSIHCSLFRFVALGTSLPDTFASRIAAQNEKTADNAIGNITGSNSVNIFLGLGLPWVFATVYWGWKVSWPMNNPWDDCLAAYKYSAVFCLFYRKLSSSMKTEKYTFNDVKRKLKNITSQMFFFILRKK
jgi:hypothetical protein